MIRPKSPVVSFRHALNGILLSVKTQRQLRAHCVLALLALVAGIVWRLNRAELAILVGTIFLVIVAELINTAVETVVDLVTPDYHPLAKIAKDVAAGAVLAASVSAVLIGLLLFFDLSQFLARLHQAPIEPDVTLTGIVGFTMLMIVLVFWKVKSVKGRFLHGGVVSGHTAIAFFLGTLVVLVSNHPLVAFMALLLALLVAQSRVEAGVHTLQEVLFGALLGVLIPVLLHRLIPALLHQLTSRLPGGAH